MSVVSSSIHDDFEALLRSREDIVANPYPLYARMRREDPVHFHGSHWVLTRFKDVSSVQKDPRFLVGQVDLDQNTYMREIMERLSPENQAKLREVYEFRDGWLSSVNGEKHDRMRGLAQKAFTPKVIRGAEQRVQEVADELLDKVAAKGEMDLVADFAWQLPLIVISEMLDIPREDRYDLRRWSLDIAGFAQGQNLDALDTALHGVRKMREYLEALFARRRGTHADDLMGALIAAEGDDGDHFSTRELVPMVSLLIFAGHETTTNLILNACNAMLGEFRDQWSLLREDPSYARFAADETLRYDTSAQFTDRTAAEDVEIDGVRIAKWDSVHLGMGSANRDPERYEDADRYDLTRDPSKHVGLGIGPHYCLGASLARLEMTVAISTLVRRMPDLEFAAPPTRVRGHRIRGFSSMPVRFTAASG